MGITRLNAYAGMAAGYLITDPVLTALTTGDNPAIPDLAHTIPLIIQDKGFKTVADQWGKVGDLPQLEQRPQIPHAAEAIARAQPATASSGMISSPNACNVSSCPWVMR